MKRGSASLRSRDKILAVATEYLSAHHDQEITASDAAKVAGVGTRTLQIAFREGLNTTPGDWLLKFRLRRSRQVLLAAETGTSVTFAAHNSGLHHLGRFAQRYREEFGEAPSETLKSALKLKNRKRPGAAAAMTARDGVAQRYRQEKTVPSPDEKAMTSIECGQILASETDVGTALDEVHRVLLGRLNYKRGAVILKRRLDGRPLIFSHCRGEFDEARFRLDMNRVNLVLASETGIVYSVLKKGAARIENDLDLAVDYASLDASVQSELCVPLVSGGEIIGAMNFESDRKNAFDLHDIALASAISSSVVGQLQNARSLGSQGLSARV